ncbi:MAG: SulP family inorganic anion transporter, partial [Pseudomonadales bacterium]
MRRLLNDFRPATLRGDFYGGLSAAIVALPLGLAFGVASGAGPMAGVYSAVLVGFFASVFGGTPGQISGPTGPMTVVMTAILTEYISRDPVDGMAGAFAIVVLAGLFQIAFGLLRLGKYVVQVSYPVISGFMSGIGVIIILLQLQPLVGEPGSASPVAAMMDLPRLITAADLPTLTLGLTMLLILFIWRGRFNVLIPGPVLVLIVGTIVALLIPGLSGVSVLGELPGGLPTPILPHFNPVLLVEELTSALLIAALGSIDSLLTSLVADNLTQTHHDSDKELIGQGIGNMIAGFFAALPGAGATVRTVVNIKSGGRSAYSGVIHALLVVFIILVASPLAEHIPHVVLAAILLKVGVDIIDRRFLLKVHRMPLVSAGLMLGVLLLTVFVDLITAVFVGVFIANMITVERLTNLQLDNVRLVDDFDQELRESGVETEFED